MKIKSIEENEDLEKKIREYGINRMARQVEADPANLHKMVQGKKVMPDSMYNKIRKVLQ